MGFIDRPQQVWWRRALFQVHLWTGVVLCLYIAVIGLTGSLLVVRDEIERTAFHNVIMCKDCSIPNRVSLAQIITTVRTAHPQRVVQFAYLPRHADENALVATLDKTTHISNNVFVSPVTGNIVGETQPDRFWLTYVGQIHYFLLMGETGLIINGIGAAFLLLLTLSGVVIWWPGLRRWKRAFGVKVSASWRRINFDLHSAVGFWTLAVLLIWSLSSIYFAWPQQVGKLMEHVSSIASMQPPRIKLPQHNNASELSIAMLLHAGEAASPNAHLYGVFMPRGKSTPLTVLMARGKAGDFYQMDYVFVDQFQGNVLNVWHRGAFVTRGVRAITWLEQLHFGIQWGVTIKIIWFILGLSFPVLSITGLLMYWNRSLRHKWKMYRNKGQAA